MIKYVKILKMLLLIKAFLIQKYVNLLELEIISQYFQMQEKNHKKLMMTLIKQFLMEEIYF